MIELEAEKPYMIVDRPKTQLRVVALAIWGVSGFLFYKAVADPPNEPWALLGVLLIFGVCSAVVVREFFFRPMRVTTVPSLARQIVVQETARWRQKEFVASIAPGTRFEVFQQDDENALSFGVRIRSMEHGLCMVAEDVSKVTAERLAREANRKLAGG